MSLLGPLDRRRLGSDDVPDFMVMIHADEAVEAQLPPHETKVLVEGHTAYVHRLREAGVYLDGERLRPATEGRRVYRRDGRVCVESGPFAELSMGAFWVVTAETLDAALGLARDCPRPPGASLDVRPVMKGEVRPGKASHPGRVFAFVVLGNAPSEEAWVDVMERIDRLTQSHFPGDRWQGGVRLHAPSAGRRVAGGHRTVFDGPFLEGKEVIGGVFFMRMTSLDEAVSWAGGTAFVIHGGLEIRELWRS